MYALKYHFLSGIKTQFIWESQATRSAWWISLNPGRSHANEPESHEPSNIIEVQDLKVKCGTSLVPFLVWSFCQNISVLILLCNGLSVLLHTPRCSSSLWRKLQTVVFPRCKARFFFSLRSVKFCGSPLHQQLQSWLNINRKEVDDCSHACPTSLNLQEKLSGSRYTLSFLSQIPCRTWT